MSFHDRQAVSSDFSSSSCLSWFRPGEQSGLIRMTKTSAILFHMLACVHAPAWAIGWKLFGGRKPVPTIVSPGVSVDEHADLSLYRTIFEDEAGKKNKDLRILYSTGFARLASEGIAIGITGPSDSSNFNLAAYEREVSDFLTTIPRTQVILISRSTDVGVPSLVFKHGDLLNIPTIGVGPLEATKFSAPRMDALFIDGIRLLGESEPFIRALDILAAFGGSHGTEYEMELARKAGKTVMGVRNAEILGASEKAPLVFNSGKELGQAVREIIFKMPFFQWLENLRRGIERIDVENLRTELAGMSLIGFPAWDEEGPGIPREDEVRAFVTDFLSGSKSKNILVGTNGIDKGLNKIVHEVAQQQKIVQIALVSHEIAEKGTVLNPYVRAVIPISRARSARRFVNLLDQVVVFGTDDRVDDYEWLGNERGIPVARMKDWQSKMALLPIRPGRPASAVVRCADVLSN
ncbi:MAG: hypothetical protein C5B49_04260 [Bdellovibrio sp.]|nr:MAG: hypothetical protein C5B49_04260 [Bdellovibrio sp.]